MRKKLFTHGTTFFMTAEMYDKVKKITDSLEIGVSDFIRGLIEDYLRNRSFNSEIGKEGKQCPENNWEDNHGFL